MWKLTKFDQVTASIIFTTMNKLVCAFISSTEQLSVYTAEQCLSMYVEEIIVAIFPFLLVSLLKVIILGLYWILPAHT